MSAHTAADPVVDVVMMSRADRMADALMTQEAIDTCIAGANPLPVNLIVMEQNPDVTYARAWTFKMPGEFNYNRFANIGAIMGGAPWLMVANNDLIFHDGWLDNLLAAQHPVVSPKCPRDSRQAHITTPTLGYRAGVHFSGWCFMLKRELWERMGEFDESVSFWCSDDIVIEQLRALDVQPMLVPDARVEHVQSVTLRRQDPGVRDELTWKQLDIFERQYGPHRLARNAHYQRWKKQYGLA